MWTWNFVLPGIQPFTAVQLVIYKKSWKNRKGFALLYIQAKAVMDHCKFITIEPPGILLFKTLNLPEE